MNNIFDDSDEEEKPEAPLQPSSSKTDNAGLFGSDSSDDEKSESEALPKDPKEEDPTVADESAANEISEEKKAKDSDEESDAEFKDDGITGKIARPSASSPVRENAQSITVPRVSLPHFQNENVSLHMAQLPKVVAIQSEAYDSSTYNASVEDAEFQGRGNGMIRWRYKSDENGELIRNEKGELVRESNSTIIKWSDGTYGLRVGDEVFDMVEVSCSLKKRGESKMQKNANSKDKNVRIPDSKEFMYLTQQARIDEDGETKPVGTILECVRSLQSKFKVRPASLTSKAHKKFVLQERRRQVQRAQIQEHVTFVDPEKQKAERIRNKEDLMKQEKRSGGRRSTGGGGRRRYGMHRAYMEEDDEHYDTVNIRSLKRRNDDMDYGDDTMMSDEEDEWSKKKKRGFETGRKTSQYLSEEDSEEEEELVLDDEDEDEEDIVNRKNASRAGGNKRKSAFLDDDDSE